MEMPHVSIEQRARIEPAFLVPCVAGMAELAMGIEPATC
jgi:hypothetical protein